MEITKEKQKAYSEAVKLIQELGHEIEKTGTNGPLVFLSGILDFYALSLRMSDADSPLPQISKSIPEAIQGYIIGEEYDFFRLLDSVYLAGFANGYFDGSVPHELEKLAINKKRSISGSKTKSKLSDDQKNELADVMEHAYHEYPSKAIRTRRGDALAAARKHLDKIGMGDKNFKFETLIKYWDRKYPNHNLLPM